jgi:rhodanese-related sulfurtransferase
MADVMADWGSEIAVGTLQQARLDGVLHTLLDVREPNEVAVCAISDSLCIPMQQVPQHLGELPREHPLVIMCHHGARSDQVAQFLRANGFTNAHNLAGGIDAWAMVVDPEMARY